MFRFCERFGGTPSQWLGESYGHIREFITMWAAENDVEKMRRKAKEF